MTFLVKTQRVIDFTAVEPRREVVVIPDPILLSIEIDESSLSAPSRSRDESPTKAPSRR